VIAYRLCKTKYVSTALSGYGAKEYGGRWNSVGRTVVYLSSSIALAALEVLVHVPNQNLLRDPYTVIPLEFPDDTIQELDQKILQPDWTDSPAPEYLQQIGDTWIETGLEPILRVPSAVITAEANYLFNPEHTKASVLKILEPQEFFFDSRLVR
jgi:RES domain-containing protein